MTLAGPLAGVVVVAIEQAVAAPLCTARLSDAGAEVIKIERPDGDFARGYDDVARGQSSYFVWLNRGKKSVVVDLATEVGKRQLANLIDRADVVVQNLKPGALSRLGFGAEELLRKNPMLIVCSISGYGQKGPLASRKAYDLLIQAEAGLCSVTGSQQAPSRVGISVVDIATGATAYSAILEALIARGVSKMGANIHVSMFDVLAEWMTVPLLQAEAGKAPRRMGLAHPSIAPYGVFSSRDGAQLLISIQSEREWRSLASDILGDEALTSHPAFSTNVARVRNRDETDRIVAEAFARLDRHLLMDKLNAADIAFAEVNDMVALSCHPHLRRIVVQTPTGDVAMPAPAPIFAGVHRNYDPVPELGQQNGTYD